MPERVAEAVAEHEGHCRHCERSRLLIITCHVTRDRIRQIRFDLNQTHLRLLVLDSGQGREHDSPNKRAPAEGQARPGLTTGE